MAESETTHEHTWRWQQNVTSKGAAMSPIWVCDCGAAEPATAPPPAPVPSVEGGLREAVEALADQYEHPRWTDGVAKSVQGPAFAMFARDLRTLLAAASDASPSGRADDRTSGEGATSREGMKPTTAAMDRPAYELVRLLTDLLDDCDQVTDTPDKPNRVNVWAVREVMEAYGGRAHRWSHPRCQECDHTVGFHHDWGGCDLCDCQMTRREVAEGRDVELDEAIERAQREESP